MFSDDSEKVDWEKELEEERKELNEEKKKQKGEDLFAAFKKDTSSVTATKSTKNSSISSLFDVSIKKHIRGFRSMILHSLIDALVGCSLE